MLLAKDEDMKPVVLGCVVGLLLALSSAQVVAQPLAEIARREKLRREALAAKERQERGVLTTVVRHPELPMGRAVWTPEAVLGEEALLAADVEEIRKRMLAEQPGQWESNGAELYLEPVLGPPR